MEICGLMGRACREGDVSEPEILEAASAAPCGGFRGQRHGALRLERFPQLGHLAVTDGARCAFLFSRSRRVRFQLPRVECSRLRGLGPCGVARSEPYWGRRHHGGRPLGDPVLWQSQRYGGPG